MDWIQQYASAINVLCTAVLVFLTGWYAFLTKKMLTALERQSKLSLNPVIGIEVGEMIIGKVDVIDRRNMQIPVKLTNIGNAPAIEVLIDAEIVLYHSTVNGVNTIPSRFDPEMISFLKPGESNKKSELSFGNTFITAFLDSVRETYRLNIQIMQIFFCKFTEPIPFFIPPCFNLLKLP